MFIKRLDAQKGKNMLLWQNEFFAPKIAIDTQKKEIQNLQFPSIDAFSCQNANIKSTPFAYFRANMSLPNYISSLAGQYYLDGPIVDNVYEREMHDELVSVLLNKNAYCQREKIAQNIVGIMFQRI